MKKVMIGMISVYLVQGCTVIEGQPCEDLLRSKDRNKCAPNSVNK